jgi:uncharacterized membrane protein
MTSQQAIYDSITTSEWRQWWRLRRSAWLVPVSQHTSAPLPEAVDAVANNPVSGLLDRLLSAVTSPFVPSEDSPWRSEALGHSLHPVLTDLPLGCWTSAALLDALGGKRSRPAATRLIALGLLSAGPTAYAGLASWSRLEGPERRLGAVHAVGNDIAIVLFGASWLARVRGRHGRGVRLALLGNLATAAAGHLGGVLALQHGTGDRRNAPGTGSPDGRSAG